MRRAPSFRHQKLTKNQPPVILSEAKALRSFPWFEVLRTTAEILRFAEDATLRISSHSLRVWGGAVVPNFGMPAARPRNHTDSAILAMGRKFMDLTMPVSDNSMPRPHLVSARKRLFMASLLLAFLFPRLTWEQAAGCALLLILFNTLILPWLEIDVSKQSPPAHIVDKTGGLILYPTSVLVVVLLYPHHLHVAAAAWALVALGDGMATVAGEAVNLPIAGGRQAAVWRRQLAAALPWNRSKTWAGFLGFVAAGTIGAYILTRWIASAITPGWTLIVCVAAALLCALLESLPLALDDNITVPLVGGAFLFCAFLIERSALDSNLPYLRRRIGVAIVVNLAFAVLAYALKAASGSGAICGFWLGTAIYLGYGYKSFILLFAFIVLGSVATRLGIAKKTARGVAERRAGARSWREALANLLAAAFFAILVVTTHHEGAFLIALVAALAEAAGDTFSSEIGQWVSDRAYLLTTFKPVRVGENGGVSVSGTAAGFAASAVIVALGLGLGLCGPYRFAGPAIALGAAVAGNLLDSLLGATLERCGLATNGMVNFAGTSFAGGLALGLALHLGL